ncbi:unnamed protein product [Nippostrongylus brasiliensis]|uniref:Pentatricopeptide repeat-containing protein n=1 Tax=Nippostrongylus brasiliensis TaxID=27835 RepID=A0A0N4Y6A2_NIPBR|nr:unnamed protein product [Nippostrongylus brasiliensis]
MQRQLSSSIHSHCFALEPFAKCTATRVLQSHPTDHITVVTGGLIVELCRPALFIRRLRHTIALMRDTERPDGRLLVKYLPDTTHAPK